VSDDATHRERMKVVAHERAKGVLDASGLEDPFGWSLLADLRYRGTALLTRTSDTVALVHWSLGKYEAGTRVPLQDVVDAGVAVADIANYCRARRGGTGHPALSVDTLVVELDEVRTYWGEVSVRDAVGWVLVSILLGMDPIDVINRWYAPREGVMDGGWRYAAAGFTRDEIVQARADGTLDEDAVSTLIALRGDVILPAG
jgi:hypothetical protein